MSKVSDMVNSVMHRFVRKLYERRVDEGFNVFNSKVAAYCAACEMGDDAAAERMREEAHSAMDAIFDTFREYEQRLKETGA